MQPAPGPSGLHGYPGADRTISLYAQPRSDPMPDPFHAIIGTLLIATSAANARLYYTRRLGRRSSRIRKVMSAPAGFPVRTALLIAAVGVSNLTSAWPAAGWPVIGVEAAIIAWEATIQATGLVRRARRRAPSVP
jgi:hypothetical protein